MGLSNQHLAGELKELAAAATTLADQVSKAEDLAPRVLAGATVEAVKIAGRLDKLGDKLDLPPAEGGRHTV